MASTICNGNGDVYVSDNTSAARNYDKWDCRCTDEYFSIFAAGSTTQLQAVEAACRNDLSIIAGDVGIQAITDHQQRPRGGLRRCVGYIIVDGSTANENGQVDIGYDSGGFMLERESRF